MLVFGIVFRSGSLRGCSVYWYGGCRCFRGFFWYSWVLVSGFLFVGGGDDR